MIRTVDIKEFPVRSAAILTTSYVAGTVLDRAQDYNQLVLLVSFTKGSLTTAEVKIEFSNDGSTYYQETFQSISSGTSTDTVGEHALSATGNYTIMVPILSRYIKVSAKGTGTVTSSSMAITAMLGVV